MAKIHIIYDPNDRIEHKHDRLKEMGIRVAVLSLGDDSFANIGATAETLACLLLDEVAKEAGS